MAAVDPNVYALSIQLQLESQAATDKINEFVVKLEDVEKKISASATKALANISESFGKNIESVSKSLSNAASQSMVGVAGSFDNTAKSMADKLAAAASTSLNDVAGTVDNTAKSMTDKLAIATAASLNDVSTSVEKTMQSASASIAAAANSSVESMNGPVENILATIESIDDEITTQIDLNDQIEEQTEKHHKDNLKILKTEEDRTKVTKSLWASFQSGLKFVYDNTKLIIASKKATDDLAGGFANVSDKVKEKIEFLNQELEVEKKSEKAIGKMGNKADALKGSFGEVYGSLKQMFAGFVQIIEFFAELDKGAENFVTANYRMYGSQTELLNNSRMLSLEFGLAAENAIEVVKALADAGTKKDDLEKLSKTVAMTARVTGVGARELADYTRKLRSSGLNAENMQKHLEKMTAGMRKFGLSTSDINMILSKSDDTVSSLSNMYGSKGLVAINEFQMGMSGLAKQMGKSPEEINKFYNALDAEKMLNFTAVTGQTIKNIETDFPKAMYLAGQQMNDLKKQMEDLIAAGDTSEADKLQLTYNQIADALGMTSTMADVTVERYRRLEEEARLTGLSVEELSARVMDSQTLAEEYNKSITNVWKQLDVLKQKFAFVGIALSYVSESVGAFLYVLNSLLNLLNPVIQAVIDFLRPLSQNLSPNFVFWIKAIVGAIVVLAGGLIIGGISISGFLLALYNLRLGLAATQISFASFGTWISSTAAMLGNLVIGFFRTMGLAVRAFGSAIQPVIGTIILFAAAMALVGAAVLMTAAGIYILAKLTGDEFTVGIMTAAIVLLLLGAAVAVLGYFATGALPGLLAIAAVIAAIGFVVLAVGVAMYLAAMSLQLINKLIGEDGLVGNLFSAIPVLYAFGLAAAVSSIGVALLGIAMSTLGYGALMVSAAIFILVAAFVLLMKMVSPEQIRKMALVLKDVAKLLGPVALELVAVGFLMIIVGLTLVVGGILLLIGAAILWVAGMIFKSAAGWLVQTHELLMPVVPDLLNCAWDILKIGLYIFGGGLALLIGSILLLVGVIILGIAAVGLGAAGVALRVAINLMQVAAEWLEKEGMQIERGGRSLKIGAEALRDGVEIMDPAVSRLGELASTFSDAITAWNDVTPQFIALADSIANGGAEIQRGAEALNIGVYSLQDSVLLLDEIKDMFIDVVNSLVISSGILVIATTNILISGIFLAIGSTLLLIGSGILSLASMALIATSVYVTIAGTALRVAGIVLLIATLVLLVGSIILLVSALMLNLGATLVVEAMLTLSMAAVGMFPLAIEIMTGAKFLSFAFGYLAYVSGKLMYAGLSMFVGSYAIYRALTYLEFAVARFSGSIDKIVQLGGAMEQITKTFKTMAELPADKIRQAAIEASDTVPIIDQMADAMILVAEKFRDIDLGDSFNAIADQLEAYAERVESVSERVWTAVNETAVPALRAAEQAGIKDAVKSEVIQTVKVTQEEAGELEGESEQITIAQQQLDVLKDMAEAVKELVPEGTNPVTLILNLLESYLPNIARKDSGLSTEFNAWAK